MINIGILCRKQTLEETMRYFINAPLIDALSSLPVMLRPILPNPHIEQEAIMCDGVILPGGIDVCAAFHGQTFDPFSQYYEGFADIEELLLIEAFQNQRKPILGICRGMQVLQVYFHGMIEANFDTFHHQEEHLHWINIAENSYLRQLYPKRIEVNSYHHQRITHIAPSLQVDAYCADGTIEAFHHSHAPIFGVQWHPELLKNDRLLPYFLSVVSKKITSFQPSYDSP